MKAGLTYIDILKDEFEKRIRLNKNYSLRAFARDLGISVSRLSEFLNGKSGLSSEKARVIARNIPLNREESDIFVAMVDSKFSRSPKKRKEALLFLEKESYKNIYQYSCKDSLKFISEWCHYAILSVMELDSYDGTIKYIQSKIELEESVIVDAIERMERLGHVLRNKYGEFYSSGENITTTHNIASKTLRDSHRDTLMHAIESLLKDDVSVRDITSITVATSLEKIEQAKEKITNFRRELALFLESEKKEEVYNLNIQLVPLTSVSKKE